MRKATLKLNHVEIRVLLEAITRDKGRYARRGTPMAGINLDALDALEARLRQGFLEIERPKVRLLGPSKDRLALK